MNARLALRHRLLCAAATARLRLRRPAAARRNREFDHYFSRLAANLRRAPLQLRLQDRERLASRPDGGAIWRVTLAADAAFAYTPGDLLYVRWENRTALVEEITNLLPPAYPGRRVVWTDSLVWSPARRVRVTAPELLSRILDLEVSPDGSAPLAPWLREHPHLATWEALVAGQPRMRPRLYTIAAGPTESGDNAVELLVSVPHRPAAAGAVATPGRGGGFLASAARGTVVEAHCLPHPHRLPCAHGHAGPGLAVVTGTAVAGVRAFLRAGRLPAGSWIVWGIRHPDDFTAIQRELTAAAAAGVIGRLDIISSRRDGRRVPEHLRAMTPAVRTFLDGGGWVYLSGHEAMAEVVERDLSALVGTATWTAWKDDLRVVESASG